MTFTLTIRIISTVFPGLAIVLTALRLYYRGARRHLGWDDAWAALAACSAFFETAGSWIRNSPSESHYHRLVGYYMLNVSFTSVLWAARMAIIASVLRVIPHLMMLRRYAMTSAFLLFAMWLANIAAKIYVCESNPAWKNTANVQCFLGIGVGILELTTDIIADMILVVLPLYLLWGIGISNARRKLLIMIFSASAVTTIVSIVHASYVFGPDRDGESITAHLEASVSLIICNLAVLVTWLVRTLRRGEDLDDVEGISEDTTGRPPLSSLRFGQEPPIVLLSMNDDTSHSSKGTAASTVKSTASSEPELYSTRKDTPESADAVTSTFRIEAQERSRTR